MSEHRNPYETDKPKCKGCIYAGALMCEYILITEKSPQSQGVKLDPDGKGGCALKKLGKKKKNRMPALRVSQKQKRNRSSKLDIPEAKELYNAGASDHEIAKRTQTSFSTVRAWRRRHGLPSNSSQGERPSANKYVVRSATSGEVLAEGTARQCGELLGLGSTNSFYSMVARANRGGSGKYVVEKMQEEVRHG